MNPTIQASVFYKATEAEIVVYWDKPQDLSGEVKYGAQLLHGGETLRTLLPCRTHCTFEDLDADTEYLIRINNPDGQQIGEIACRTAKMKRRIDVTASPYHAVPDGKTLNTLALQQAIDDCDSESMVYLPAGTFLTGALDLHGNMELYLEEGALLQGTADPADYMPLERSRFEGHERLCFRSLLNLGKLDHESADYNCENVVIRGKGKIYGGGFELAKKEAAIEAEKIASYIKSLGDKISEFENPSTPAFRVRGRLIQMNNCRNVWIHGLDMGFGPSWNIHFIYSKEIVTDGCVIRSGGVWNGDGWDPDSSEDCTLFGCVFHTEDDCVAIKSGKNPEGNQIGRPSRNIRVFDCETKYGHGLCIGSEMSGGVENVSIWDCEMGPTWSGIEIKATKRRGGYVRNISVRDTRASHVMIHSVGFNDDGEGAEHPPLLSGFSFRGMHLLGKYLDNNNGKMCWHQCPPIEVIGFDEPGHEVRDVLFEDIIMENMEKEKAAVREDIYRDDLPGSIVLKNCKSVTLKNLVCVMGKSALGACN